LDIDIVTASESAKANKSRKKKGPDPLEVERQKEFVRLMKKWLGKGRTQGQLHIKSKVATTSISDALKPGTITNLENTLDILEVVASPKEFLSFVQKFFPAFRTHLKFVLKINDQRASAMGEFLDFAEDYIDDQGDVRQESIKSIKEAFKNFMDRGVLYSKNGKETLFGGKARGMIIEVCHATFNDILASSGEHTCVKFDGKEYNLDLVHPELGFAIFKEGTEGYWAMVVSTTSTAFGQLVKENSAQATSEEIAAEEESMASPH
jgi:hypothetical protein